MDPCVTITLSLPACGFAAANIVWHLLFFTLWVVNVYSVLMYNHMASKVGYISISVHVVSADNTEKLFETFDFLSDITRFRYHDSHRVRLGCLANSWALLLLADMRIWTLNRVLMAATLNIFRGAAITIIRVTYMRGKNIVPGIGISSTHPHADTPFIITTPPSYEYMNEKLHILFCGLFRLFHINQLVFGYNFIARS